MDLAYVVFLHITYLSFLGSAATRMEVVQGDSKKWKFLQVNRVRRDLQTPVQSPDATSTFSFVKPEDTKDPQLPQSSNGAHIRVKRYRHSFGNYPPTSRGCKFGTCIVHNLANQIYQYTDKDKDITAPARKISSQGYGKRRRRSVPDRRLLMPFVDGTFRPQWVNAGKARTGARHLLDILQRTSTQRGLAKTKGKMWQTLLRT
ncbi:pro-adrenomedullin [Bufo gargarizans]|uniref:pro-adrenomedullin n=1 Tax=Bufo gargarizans TaxID=30331 RepID=UPI001CF29679|nr:pro-adrenomedullin [Bufo gargarizans]